MPKLTGKPLIPVIDAATLVLETYRDAVLHIDGAQSEDVAVRRDATDDSEPPAKERT